MENRRGKFERLALCIIILIPASLVIWLVFNFVFFAIFIKGNSFLSGYNNFFNWLHSIWALFTLAAAIVIALMISYYFAIHRYIIYDDLMKRSGATGEDGALKNKKNWEKISSDHAVYGQSHKSSGIVMGITGYNARTDRKPPTVYVETESHGFIGGPTGSGKSQILNIPTIIHNSFTEDEEFYVETDYGRERRFTAPNMVIPDVKGELYQKTKEILNTNGYKIHKIDFSNSKESISWNPLTLVCERFLNKEFKEGEQLLVNVLEQVLEVKDIKGDAAFWSGGERGMAKGMVYILVLAHLAGYIKKNEVSFSSMYQLTAKLDKLLVYYNELGNLNEYPIRKKGGEKMFEGFTSFWEGDIASIGEKGHINFTNKKWKDFLKKGSYIDIYKDKDGKLILDRSMLKVISVNDNTNGLLIKFDKAIEDLEVGMKFVVRDELEAKEIVTELVSRASLSLDKSLTNAAKAAKKGDTDKLVASFMQGLVTKIEIFEENKDITQRDDLSLIDWDNEKNALFVLVPYEQKALFKIVPLFINQLYVSQIQRNRKLKREAMARKNILVWDEMPQFPAIDQFPEMIKMGRSANFQFMVSTQDIASIKTKYGRDETTTILNNCNLQIWFRQNDIETAEYVSKLAGERIQNPTMHLGTSNGVIGSINDNKKQNLTYSDARKFKTLKQTKNSKNPFAEMLITSEKGIGILKSNPQYMFGKYFDTKKKKGEDGKVKIYKYDPFVGIYQNTRKGLEFYKKWIIDNKFNPRDPAWKIRKEFKKELKNSSKTFYNEDHKASAAKLIKDTESTKNLNKLEVVSFMNNLFKQAKILADYEFAAKELTDKEKSTIKGAFAPNRFPQKTSTSLNKMNDQVYEYLKKLVKEEILEPREGNDYLAKLNIIKSKTGDGRLPKFEL